VDRYVAIKKPFHYQKLTPRSAVLVISLAVFIALIHIVPSYLFNTTYIAVSFIIILGTVFLCISNLVLYHEVKKTCTKIASTIVHDTQLDELHLRCGVKKRQLKSLKICILIVLSFLLLWLPFLFVSIMRRVKEYVDLKPYGILDVKRELHLVANVNGILDVIIFLSINKQAKNVLKKTFS